MTVRFEGDGPIVLDGTCPIDDAEPLLQLLTTVASPSLDWRTCDWAHTAIIQILLASRVPVLGPPRGAFLKDVIGPLIIRAPDPI